VKVENPVKDKEPEKELEHSLADDKSDKELGVDLTQTVFSDDKYTESFEEIEDHIKNLEDKCIDSFETIENIIKSQERIYVDNFETIVNRIKSQDKKFDQILRYLGASKAVGEEGQIGY